MNAIDHNKVPGNDILLARRSEIIFLLLAVLMGAVHTWAAIRSHSMNADGIVYLDIGDAYLRGDWANAINPVWSPLYSWVLGLVMVIVQPSIHLEFPLVHLINLGIFLLALFAFADFWRRLGRYKDQVLEHGEINLPDWAWISLGYGLFIWVSLSLINIWAVTPDMLMAIFVLMAAGQIVRIRHNAAKLSPYILLGIVLGFGYLAKTVMFPLGLLFLGTALFTSGIMRVAVPRTAMAAVFFLFISLPYIALISNFHGRFTIGEAGSLTYLRYVKGITYPHWQRDEGAFGIPAHPSRLVFVDPPIYEFNSPIGGTYPISYNPAYWYDGATVQFIFPQQMQALLNNGFYYFDLFFRQQGGLMLGVLVLFFFSYSQLHPLKNIIHKWGLSLLALAAFVLYSLVYVEGRYVGIFVLLFWSDLLATLRLPDASLVPRLMKFVSVVMISFLLANFLTFNLEGFGRIRASASKQVFEQEPPPSWPGEVAESLWELGMNPGDKVAVIGYAFDSFWARLAKVQIVAEMFNWQADPFWLGDQAFQEEVLLTFAGTGARAVVAEHVPDYAQLPGWHQVGNSNYYIYLLTLDD